MTETAQERAARAGREYDRRHAINLANVVDRLNAEILAAKQNHTDAIEAALAREAALLKEGSALSAWQCIFADGRTGLSSDEHGHQFCQMQRRAEAAESREAALRDALAFYAPSEAAGIKFQGGDDGGYRARAALAVTA